MQTTNPTEHGYVSGNGLLIHNQSSHTSEWKTYLQGTHNFIPPMDEHKTFIYSSNQCTEFFSVRSRLNLFSFYSFSGKYEVNMTSCLTEFVDILSRIFVSSIPHQKVLNMIGYKLLVYLPDTIQPPFGFIRDELYTHDFLGGVLPKESMRLYIRNFQYNDQLGLHALPCNEFEYSIISSFYKLNVLTTSPVTGTISSGTTVPVFGSTPSTANTTVPVFGSTPITPNTTVPVFGSTQSTPNTTVPVFGSTPSTAGTFGTTPSTTPSTAGMFGTTPNATTYNSGTFGTTSTVPGFGYNIFSKK